MRTTWRRKRRSRAEEMWGGTGSSGWAPPTEDSGKDKDPSSPHTDSYRSLLAGVGASAPPAKGSGRWWSWARCCASPSRSLSETPPGPCTGAGRGCRHRAESSPTAVGPGRPTGSWTAATQSRGRRRRRAPQLPLPESLHRSPRACLCLEGQQAGGVNVFGCNWLHVHIMRVMLGSNSSTTLQYMKASTNQLCSEAATVHLMRTCAHRPRRAQRAESR